MWLKRGSRNSEAALDCLGGPWAPPPVSPEGSSGHTHRGWMWRQSRETGRCGRKPTSADNHQQLEGPGKASPMSHCGEPSPDDTDLGLLATRTARKYILVVCPLGGTWDGSHSELFRHLSPAATPTASWWRGSPCFDSTPTEGWGWPALPSPLRLTKLTECSRNELWASRSLSEPCRHCLGRRNPAPLPCGNPSSPWERNKPPTQPFPQLSTELPASNSPASSVSHLSLRPTRAPSASSVWCRQAVPVWLARTVELWPRLISNQVLRVVCYATKDSQNKLRKRIRCLLPLPPFLSLISWPGLGLRHWYLLKCPRGMLVCI